MKVKNKVMGTGLLWKRVNGNSGLLVSDWKVWFDSNRLKKGFGIEMIWISY